MEGRGGGKRGGGQRGDGGGEGLSLLHCLHPLPSSPLPLRPSLMCDSSFSPTQIEQLLERGENLDDWMGGRGRGEWRGRGDGAERKRGWRGRGGGVGEGMEELLNKLDTSTNGIYCL